MNFSIKHVNTIFNQLPNLLPRNRFEQFVGQYNADRYVKRMSCWNQFSIMLYAQAKGKESLRDIETSLGVQEQKLYRLGIRSKALFPWAKFGKTKGAIKLHCLFDIRDQIPEFIVHSEGRENNLTVAKNSDIVFSPDSIKEISHTMFWRIFQLMRKGLSVIKKLF